MNRINSYDISKLSFHDIKELEENYKDYKINEIDCSLDIKQDINLNQIFTKRNEVLLQKIETIAENM